MLACDVRPFGGPARWVAAALALGACTAGGGGRSLPDATLTADAPTADAGVDSGFPEPRVDTCTAESKDSTLGGDCSGNAECDDGCFCNGAEQCVDGTCAASENPCVDDVECTVEACLEETEQCFRDPQHSVCSDGNACNGAELCDRTMGCVAAPPLYCNDESACTVDTCDPEEGCIYTLRDLDGDGFGDDRCGGDDCDDDPRFGRAVYPGAEEVCGNRRDDDCDGLRDYNDSDCVPTNGTCAAAQELDGPGTYSGSTVGLSADYSLGCRTSGPDAVFRFTLEEVSDVRVALGGGGTGAAVALRRWGRCAGGPDLKCASSSRPSLLRRSLAAGSYAIVVKTGSGAPFDLTLAVGPPTPVPPVDACGDGTLEISEGGTFTGSFDEIEDDYELSCRGGALGARDAVFRLTLDEPKDVVIRGSTTGGPFFSSTYLSLVTDCSSPSSTLACVNGSTAELLRRELPAGTYYVLLETSATEATSWSLEATVTDPVPRPPGDSCGTAVDISRGSGTAPLPGAELDAGTFCGGSSSTYRDLFFYFDLDELRDVTVRTTGAGFHFASLGTACGVTESELRCRSGSSPLAQSYRSLPAGRYFVTVATSLLSGTVTTSVTTSDPTAIPPNDRCEGAIEVGRGYSSTDTLVDFEDDVVGCTGARVPDAFYRITLTERKAVTIVASQRGGLSSLTLALRDSCSSTINRACDTGHTAAIGTELDAGTYYLIVEPTSPSVVGDFNLRVLVSDP